MLPLSAALLTCAAVVLGDAPEATVDYLRDVKPILVGHCVSCHGAIQQKGDLRVDTAALLREGGTNGPAFVPGKSESSLLLGRLLGKGGLKRMPPASEGVPLKPAQIALIKRWIDQGAPSPSDEKPEADPREHWAFRAPKRPPLPQGNEAGRGRNPVDAFLAAEQAKRGLTPQPAADKGLLLRRVTLDLIGLPPTPEELAAFLADPAPDAYEKVVDRLLTSPHYGERWGRHWLDVWRYSDWWGLGAELRNSQRHMWHWRDWVVESLNRDKGYDQMLRDMLAGDELSPTDPDAVRGTGYLARHYFLFNRTTWLDEVIEHTSKAFLGLTYNCAKCHDHKYDPINQKDYYRFRAIFEPYQLRLDQVPGQADYLKDGIPRAYDGLLEAPTYLHIRGDENRPDKSRAMSPGLPKLLAPRGLAITPVALPPEAYQPGLRPIIVANYLKQAAQQRADAHAELAKAQQQLATARQRKETPTTRNDIEGSLLLRDDFHTLDTRRWDIGPGQWKLDGGRVVQSRTGNERATLRLRTDVPADFEARVKFAILGGRQWRSVGLSFDTGGPHQPLVYLTAHAPDARVQISYKKGSDVYPPEAAQRRPVPLKQTHELRLRVRGSLLNVSVNGGPVLAYRLPVARRPGRLDLVTFDAAARFEEFTLRTLSPKAALIEKSGPAAGPLTVAQAEAAVRAAEKAIAVAEASAAAIQARAAADRAATKDAARAAAQAEKRWALAQAEQALARAEQTGNAAKLKQARAAVAAARAALANPGATYTPLAGALKSRSSNLETETQLRKPFPKVSTGRRAALARWLTERGNPLTARVAVNHIWARHFGQPLVATVFDFGRKGSPPSHPELLDWLAVEFMESGWSQKHLHRLLVTSRAYRMTSSALGAPEANRRGDPENRYLWRMNPLRMESQLVRDALLFHAGELDLSIGGPSVPTAQQDGSRRRSLYFFHSANERNRFLLTFDEADVLDCYRRRESIIPQQALALSNSKLALSSAPKIADRLARIPGAETDRGFIRLGFRALLAAEPDTDEMTACEQALAEWRRLAAPRPAAEATRRARARLVQALLNHNDFITIR